MEPSLLSRIQRTQYLLQHVLGGDAELLVELRGLTGGAIVIEPDHAAAAAHVAPPQSGASGLDGHPRAHRCGQYRFAIDRILRLEALGAEHRDHAYAPSLRRGRLEG